MAHVDARLIYSLFKYFRILFLAEFFEELEPSEKNDSIDTLDKRIEDRFNNTSLETVDFLAEFFEQLDEDEV